VGLRGQSSVAPRAGEDATAEGTSLNRCRPNTLPSRTLRERKRRLPGPNVPRKTSLHGRPLQHLHLDAEHEQKSLLWRRLG